MGHLEGMVANVQSHAVLKRDDRDVRDVIFQQRTFIGTKVGNPLHMFDHVRRQNAAPNPLVCYNRNIKKSVAGPVVTVGFSVDDVTKYPVLGYFILKFQGVSGFVGTVDHHYTI